MIHGGDIEAESLVMAMRYINGEILEAYPLEKIIPDDRARNTVGVIVGVYGDALVVLNGLNDPRCRFFRVFQQEWVVSVANIIRCQEFLRRFDISEAAMMQEMRQQW